MTQMDLCLSIFYAKNDWHKLIRLLIEPIISNTIFEIQLQYYSIYLSQKQGEHISIFLKLTTSSEYVDLKSLVSSEIASFLVRRPSLDAPLFFDKNDFFMNFPNNTFYFDLEKVPSENFEILEFGQISQIRKTISSLIINTLLIDKMDDHRLFSFALYFHIELAKVLFPNQLVAERALNTIFTNAIMRFKSEKQRRLITKKIQSIFYKNEDLFSHNIYVEQVWPQLIYFSELSKISTLVGKLGNIDDSTTVFKTISIIFCKHVGCYEPFKFTLINKISHMFLAKMVSKIR